MPECDKFKIRLMDQEGHFLGYACAICEAMGKKFESLSSGYRGCGLATSGATSNHILAKHKTTLKRGFILFCKNCATHDICHEPNKNTNPEDCPYFKGKENNPERWKITSEMTEEGTKSEFACLQKEVERVFKDAQNPPKSWDELDVRTRTKVKPIISAIGHGFVKDVEVHGSPAFRKSKKNYFSLGICEEECAMETVTRYEFTEVTIKSKETLRVVQTFDMNTGKWFVHLESVDEKGEILQKTERVELQ